MLLVEEQPSWYSPNTTLSERASRCSSRESGESLANGRRHRRPCGKEIELLFENFPKNGEISLWFILEKVLELIWGIDCVTNVCASYSSIHTFLSLTHRLRCHWHVIPWALLIFCLLTFPSACDRSAEIQLLKKFLTFPSACVHSAGTRRLNKFLTFPSAYVHNAGIRWLKMTSGLVPSTWAKSVQLNSE
jgi:hypothetical protein